MHAQARRSDTDADLAANSALRQPSLLSRFFAAEAQA